MNKVVAFFKKQEGQIVKDTESPVGVWLQGKLIYVEEGKLVAEFKVREEMTNPVGMLHGGMFALIADEMIGGAVVTLDLDKFYVSINLSIDYLYGIKKSEIVRAEAKVIRQGKSIINAECTIYDMNNNKLARATSNLVVSNISNT